MHKIKLRNFIVLILCQNSWKIGCPKSIYGLWLAIFGGTISTKKTTRNNPLVVKNYKHRNTRIWQGTIGHSGLWKRANKIWSKWHLKIHALKQNVSQNFRINRGNKKLDTRMHRAQMNKQMHPAQRPRNGRKGGQNSPRYSKLGRFRTDRKTSTIYSGERKIEFIRTPRNARIGCYWFRHAPSEVALVSNIFSL